MEANPTKDYFVGVTIAEGSFGRVVHARHKVSGKDVAIKVFEKISLSKQPLLLPSIWNERSLLMDFQSCPSVVNLWGAFHDAECLYLVMECLKGGDLQSLIDEGLTDTTDKQWWTKSVVPHYALQLVQAVEFLHKQQIIHADLKPQNVLVTPNGKLQLADFGSAVRLKSTKEVQNQQPYADQRKEQEQPTILGGTVDFASPEILRGTIISKLTMNADLWSLGCIFHALCTGASPFHAASDALALQSIMDYSNGHSVPTAFSEQHCDDALLSPEWRVLIVGLLHPIPESRLGGAREASPQSSSIRNLIPGFEAVDLDIEPPFLPSEPKWVGEAKNTKMRDGSQGWSSFLI